MLRAFGASDKGCVRSNNEDCFGIDDRLQLCLVADGMGGHNAGEVAAAMAVDAVIEYVRGAVGRTGIDDTWPFGLDPAMSTAGNLLRTAVHMAHLHILEAAGASEALSGMGTTIVAAFERRGRLTVAHVGDSRLYLYSGRQLRQLTRDDSWLARALANDPAADAAALRRHPLRNALTNVVGTRAGTDVHVAEVDLVPCDIVVMTTDGVHGVVDDRCMAGLIQGAGDVAELPRLLVRAALAGGTRDNCTALAAQYHSQAAA